jgi:exodeoxyribonuclease VII large subunit
VTVQGERAPAEIAAAIRGFNALPVDGPLPRPDVLIVARGGGSFEDLLAFSDEAVVRAAAQSAIPLISAVGHETDTTLIDFAASLRAPTPTAAAEMAVPVLRDCVEATLALQSRMLRASARRMENERRHVQALARALPRPDSLFSLPRQRFDAASGGLRGALIRNLQRHRAAFVQARALLRPRIVAAPIARARDSAAELDARLGRAFRHGVDGWTTRLENSARLLDSVSYRAVLARGFALVRGAHGDFRRRAASVVPGETLSLAFTDGNVQAVADGAGPTKAPAKSAAGPIAKPGPAVKPGQGRLF